MNNPASANGNTEKGTAASRVGLVLGPALMFLFLALPAPGGLGPAGWSTAAVAVLMATWWATEALPISATALLPLLMFPLLGITDVRTAAAPFAHPLIFLFVGGFTLALALERWHLHRRIALKILIAAGERPQAMVGGFMAATAVLSMWVSNTATTMMMLPVALSVIGVIIADIKDTPGGRNFAVCVLLGVAYSASVGGLGTLIGTPTNALLAAFLRETYGAEIGFAAWMLIGLPVVLLMLPVIWLVLTRLVYPFDLGDRSRGLEAVHRELEEMGPMGRAERRVAVICAIVALLWMTRPLLTKLAWLGGLNDTGIAIFGALLLFLTPSGSPRDRAGDPARFLMNWRWAERMPLGILLLLGGGLSLAAGFADSGLSVWIGGLIGALPFEHPLLPILAVVTLMILLTELTSNMATTATLLPVVASVAAAAGVAPLDLLLPMTLAASCAFMLPVATPPNAIVFSSGLITIPQMVRAGVILNLIGIVLISGFAYVVLPRLVNIVGF